MVAGGPPQYISLRAQGDPLKQILSLGRDTTTARFALPTFYQVTTDTGGSVRLTIEGACNPPTVTKFGQVGSQEIQDNVTVYFN